MLKLKLLLIPLYFYIFFVLLNYDNAWMHREVAVITERILKEHSSWAERFGQVFNWQLFEGEYDGIPNSRARFFSNLFQAINIFFRSWLFQYLPPHPSLSLTWFVALILCPYFLYKLMVNLTNDKKISLLTALLYLITPGCLISITMLFHPGKVFANFFYIFCLYLGSNLIKDIPADNPSRFKQGFLVLVGVILASLFFDEYSLFIYVLMPIFYPQIFLERRHHLFVLPIYLLIPFVYFFMLVFILPKIYAALGFPGFNFFARITIDKNLPALDGWAMIVNFFLQLHDHLLAGFNAYLKNPNIEVGVTQFFSVTNHLINGDNIRLGLSLFNDKQTTMAQFAHNILFLAFIFPIISALLNFKNNLFKKIYFVYFLKSAVALVGFSIFFSVLHITNNILAGCGYYGSGFSVLFAIALGLTIKLVLNSSKWKNVLVYAFLISLAIHSLWNVRLLNYAWMVLHYRESYWELDMWLNKYSRRDIYEDYHHRDDSSSFNSGMPTSPPARNFQIVYAAWQNRRNPGLLNMIASEAPPEVRFFLLAEVPYLK